MGNVLIDPVIPEKEQRLADKIFSGVEERLGYVPAGLRLYGISPPLLQSFSGAVGYFMGHERISQKLLSFIRYLVSSDANCRFCIDFNQGILLSLGVTEQELQDARNNPRKAPLDERERELLDIALTAVDDPEKIDAARVDAARELGCSDRDVFEAVYVAANNRAFTTVLKTFNLEHQGAFA
ncbi:carboxymuconolactone decarboxylase family protein [Thiolapillus sp.]